MARVETASFKDQQGREIVIRNCLTSDAAASLDFLQAIAQETTGTNNVPGRQRSPLADVERNFARVVDEPDQLLVAAFHDAAMVGQLSCARVEPGHPSIGHIARFGVSVRSAFWGCGVASRLIAVMDAFAAARAITRIESAVRCDNHRARRRYAAAGFEEEGVRRRGALIAGSYCDEVYIAKLYPSPHS